MKDKEPQHTLSVKLPGHSRKISQMQSPLLIPNNLPGQSRKIS